jgi:4-amino-4-deoxy-L-arabinose transferase-like glycosyltransferase
LMKAVRMPIRSKAAIQAKSPKSTIFWTLFSYLLIGLTALLPRVLDLGSFLTTDEADHWIQRSEIFLNAIRSGNYAATAISAHPGVTTMWLGSAGIALRRTLFESGILHDETFSTVLALTRLPVALTHIVGILLGYRLLRRLLPPATAFLAAFLWAADPFIIAYSRVLHVDALAGTFATLSLLAACDYWHHERRPAALILSGVCGGLAVLSKSPALALLPVVGLLALAAAWRPPTTERARDIVPRRPTENEGASSSVIPLLAWGVVVATTVFALWPALWVSPLQAYVQLRSGVAVEAAEPHMLSNFFLGQIDNAPGSVFYPLALALRLTPWTLIGLLVLWRAWRSAPAVTRHDLAALAGFVVLFIVAMSLFPKKFNRYLVPVFPPIDILAAVGLAWILDVRVQILELWLARSHIQNLKSKVLMGIVALIAAVNVAWWHPYEIAYFNSALGGAQVGTQMLLAGWGEGFEQVAAWLNQQPDITNVVTVSPMVSSLRPYMRQHAQVSDPSWSDLPNKSGYVVVYIRQVQGGPPAPPFDQFYSRAIPLHTIRIAGVDYAWIYQVPPPLDDPLPADFGQAIHLRGFKETAPLQPGKTAAIQLFWETYKTPPIDYTLFAHLIAQDGKRYGQVDLLYPTSHWQANRYITTNLTLAVPANLPPGKYQLVIGLYDPSTNQRLPLVTPAPHDPTIDGYDALVLNEVHLRSPP